MTPQETGSDLPVSIWESPVEAWVSSDLQWGQGHWQQQSWEALLGLSPFGSHLQPYHTHCRHQDWLDASSQMTNREGTQPPPIKILAF